MAGRGKKTQIPEEQLKIAEKYAYNNCKNATICTILGWDRQWLEGRPDILTRLTKKRAEREVKLRQAQTDKALTSKDTTMQIFLGKNELGQSDGAGAGGQFPIQLVINLGDRLPGGGVKQVGSSEVKSISGVDLRLPESAE
jgi:hypothetical protein